MTETSFVSLGLAEPLLRALDSEGYTIPTPIQARAIPLLLQGRDLFGIAQTGTGKTAAFVLPILQHLTARPHAPTGMANGAPQGSRRPVRALILAPTRELAVQIGDSIAAYGRHLDLRHTVILGGVGHGSQIEALKRGVDIVVATPGRLLDLAQTRHMHFDHITHFVLDEGDRMFDMGFIKDVRRIVGKLPKQRQTLLFSATMPTDIAALAAEILNKPERIEVTPKVITVDRIDQRVYFVDQGAKRALLDKLLADPSLTRVIVFTRTKHRANRVSQQIERAGIPTEALHGNKSQNARQKALDGFKAGHVRVLVATDIAARGIDVDGVSHVINYELPNEPESYVHRIGRTARAGADGIALSFCDASERAYLKSIERLIRRTLTVVETGPLPKMEPLHASDIIDERRGPRSGGARRGGGRADAGRGDAGRSDGQRGAARNAPRNGAGRGQGRGPERANSESGGRGGPERGGPERAAVWTNDGASERTSQPRDRQERPAAAGGDTRARSNGPRGNGPPSSKSVSEGRDRAGGQGVGRSAGQTQRSQAPRSQAPRSQTEGDRRTPGRSDGAASPAPVGYGRQAKSPDKRSDTTREQRTPAQGRPPRSPSGGGSGSIETLPWMRRPND